MLNQHPLQAMIEGFSNQWQRERAQTQLTLGKLIAVLEALPADALVPGLHAPHSYRGYYCDLAFEREPGSWRRAADVLDDCRGAMGQVFEGYKGGEFMMGANTPVWVARWGSSGMRLMGLEPEKDPILVPDDT